ncbi:hypothetical protein BC939DRAFT_455431 [Gamsiella multidivaricata]|uniref:uncharacterized protein n=1 Tax=Gamsiella multidivaricata TaxID=101098 RepID=UPI00221F1367|nr:uncharacterized protein BC939DRAFT_455431 [Gamsiella multidivaricata]KAI7821521.1 hypothetical protein BC939DRAFT_455431 [Gamsiella multidivaricata]
MLAQNKVQDSISEEHLYTSPPQHAPLPQSYGQREFSWKPSSFEAFSKRHRMHDQRQEDQHIYEHHQINQQQQQHQYHHVRQSHQQEDAVSSREARQPRLCFNKTRSKTIHPTIANMVSSTSIPFGKSHSSPLPSPYPSFSPALSPSPSPLLRNVPMSPEPESEDIMHRPRAVYHTPSACSLLPPSPPPRRDSDDMDMDHEYAFEELSSDSVMDQCEPQRGWSSSSSLQTNSPSPLMSCTPDQLHPEYPLHHRHHPSRQQDLPPPQQQPLRDHHVPSSPPNYIVQDQLRRPQDNRREYLYHPGSHPHHRRHSVHGRYGDYHRHHHHQRSSSRSMQGKSDMAPGEPAMSPICRSSSLKAHTARNLRPRLLSVPNGTDVGTLQHPSGSFDSPPVVAGSASNIVQPVAVKIQGSPSRPQTPPFFRPLPPLPQPQQEPTDTENFRRAPAASTVAPLLPRPKYFEYMSEAQRVLYERHPPSPECDRTSSSSPSSCPASPSDISCESSVPPSPVQLRRHASYEKVLLGSRLPPPRSHSDTAATSSYGYDTRSSEPSRLHQQQAQPRHQLPRIPTFGQMSHQPLKEPETHMNSKSRSQLTSSLPILIPPHSGGGVGRSEHVLISTGVTPLQNLPGTEGMTVVRNEDGAIMVYNPIMDTMSFRCERCPGESFGRIHDLKRHQTSKHQEMTWPCDFCHRPFVRRDALLRHYTVKAARDDGLHPASHEVDRLLAARARAKMLF